MEIQLTDGAVYEYFNVPESVHRGLMSAASHGEYFGANIRKAGYHYRRVR